MDCDILRKSAKGAIAMCEKAQLERILSSIARYAADTFGDRLEATILYGSYARGDYVPDSDIDIMVLVNMDREALLSYEDQFSALTSSLSLEDADCTTISLLLDSWPHVCKWLSAVPFYKNVLQEGVRVGA
jgi:predicted nucleotidyltransferase